MYDKTHYNKKKNWLSHLGVCKGREGVGEVQAEKYRMLTPTKYLFAIPYFSSVAHHVWLFATPWAAVYQASLPITNSWSLFKFIITPLSWWCHPTISSSVLRFSSCPQSFPASGSFPMSQFFTSDGQSIGVSTSASVLPINIQGDFLQDWLAWSPCSPRDSQESSPTPQLKSINSLVLSFLYNPALTYIHDNWKNHSFD